MHKGYYFGIREEEYFAKAGATVMAASILGACLLTGCGPDDNNNQWVIPEEQEADLGLISYINDLGEGIPMPGKVYAGSPGSLLVSDEERKKADILDKTDVIMSQKATLSLWEGMTGGKKVADYMESLQLGDYTGLKDVYLSFGADEVFAAVPILSKKGLNSMAFMLLWR